MPLRSLQLIMQRWEQCHQQEAGSHTTDLIPVYLTLGLEQTACVHWLSAHSATDDIMVSYYLFDTCMQKVIDNLPASPEVAQIAISTHAYGRV